MEVMEYDHEKFVCREGEIDLVRQKAKLLADGFNLEPARRVDHFYDYAGMGKSWLLYELEYVFNQDQNRYRPLLLQMINLNRMNTDEFVKDLIDCFAKMLDFELNSDKTYVSIYEDIRQKSTQIVHIIMVDDVELLTREQLEKLENLLMMINCCDNTLIVIAGRKEESHWQQQALKPDFENKHTLSLFEIVDSDAQLSSQFSERLPVAKIHDVSGGNPGYNYLIAREIRLKATEPFDETKAIRICTKILHDSLPTNIYQALTALSVLERFDDVDEMAPVLDSYSGKCWNPSKCWELLQLLLRPFKILGVLVKWVDSAYAIDPQIRRMLERELELTNKPMWQSLHCAAYRMYKDWVDNTQLDRYIRARDYQAEELLKRNYNPEGCFSLTEEKEL